MSNSQKFHLNLNNGEISECLKDNYQECLFYKLGGFDNHYETVEQAQKGFNKIFKNQSSWFGLRSSRSEKKHDELLSTYMDSFYKNTNEQIKKFVNSSRAHYFIAYSTVMKRAESKYKKSNYRDATARLLEIVMNSKFYCDYSIQIAPNELNNAVLSVDAKEPKNVLAGTLSATDFGMITEYDFWGLNNKNAEIPDYMTDKMNDFMEKRKTKVESVLNNSAWQERKYRKKIAQTNHDSYSGSMFWGSVWERFVRNKFAEDNQHLTVYSVDEQKYRNKNALWQLGIFDGVVSDRSDKLPNIILEIKTSKNGKSWAKGVPQNYRAQTLYYLHITGFEKAFLRVLINDKEVKDFVLLKNDEIAVGSGQTVQQYIDNRVFPFLREIA